MEKFLKKIVLAMVILALLLQFLPMVAKGDAGPIFSYGVNVAPYQENNVRLIKETLSIELKEDKDIAQEKALVNANFTFANEGEKVLLKMGFPFGIKKDTLGTLPHDALVKVDGKSVNTTRIDDQSSTGMYGPWLVFNVLFNKGETKTVEVSYTGIPLGGRFVYILETGKYWKGPIGTLDINIKFPFTPVLPYLVSLKPEGYTISGNEAVYHLTNFEPSQNIEIEFLPETYYSKIKPFKDKAEQTNTASDWFNYALVLMPQNPFGPFLSSREGGFVDSFETFNFQNYVLDTFNKALDLQKEGSIEQKILLALKVPRERVSFTDGFADFSGIDITYYVKRSLAYFGDDVKSPKSDLEGKMIAYLMEYKVYADFQYGFAINGINDLSTLLNLADRYFSKTDLDIVPYVYLKLDPYKTEPIFMECFVPEVSIVNSKVIIQYSLPYSMQNRLVESGRANFDFSPEENTQYSLEQFPPYAYLVTIDLSKVLDTKDLDLRKENIKNVVSREMQVEDADLYASSFWAKFVSTYLYDILDNIAIDNGKIYFVKSSIDCTPKIENAISDLDSKTQAISNYKNKFEGTSIGAIYIDSTLTYLSNCKDLLLYAKGHPLINFVLQPAQMPVSQTKTETYAIIILSVLVAILMILLVLLMLKMKNMKKSS